MFIPCFLHLPPLGRQLLVGLLNFFKAVFGKGFKIITQMFEFVRMVFICKFAVSALDFLYGGVGRYP